MLNSTISFLKKHGGIVSAVIFVTFIAAIYACSWLVTCGIIKLITMCFGWTFTWPIATGIWLIILIAKSIFSHHTTVKK